MCRKKSNITKTASQLYLQQFLTISTFFPLKIQISGYFVTKTKHPDSTSIKLTHF